MTTVFALVGRPNVGKSTLFNRLTGRRDALVANEPGLTRDRRYGKAVLDEKPILLIDCGGLSEDVDELAGLMGDQVRLAITEADHVLFLVDARAGLAGQDHDIADYLRRQGVDVTLVLNKSDGVSEYGMSEFSELGFGSGHAISASHGRGIGLLSEALAPYIQEDQLEGSLVKHGVRVAIVGRPNVGKSTLVNRLLGEERQVVFDMPGTTRDSIELPFEHRGEPFTLIDTAGIRRKGRVEGVAEKFSVVKALDAMHTAEVSILVLDASEGMVDQDLHLLSFALDAGCGLLIAVNKWDGMTEDDKAAVKRELDRRLVFAPWIKVHFISALHGTGVGKLMGTVVKIYRTGTFDVATSAITRALERAVDAHPPPMSRGRLIKLRFAHKAGEHPPRIAIHGNQTDKLPASYVRYLENAFRKAFKLDGVPIRIDLKKSENPYEGKRNQLTPRQEKQRARIRKRK